MNEIIKLSEAKYFHQMMLKEFEDRQSFTFNLSAFLSSARSILQYALKEAKTKSSGQQWYDKQIAQSLVLSFFKEKRDINIHSEPISPVQHITAMVIEKIGLRVSASVVVKDANGNIKGQSSTETSQSETKSFPAQAPPKITIRYIFSDWAGTEDIITLCQKYIDELENFVSDGIKQGFLLGR